MVEEEYQWWKQFQAGDVEFMTNAEATKVAHLHSRIFNHALHKPCKCTPAKWQKMIDDINAVYDTYEQ
jgi:murein L,D-transpeptidase YafK